jgi:membrane-associated protease RseP (regulator of RpoE activity)
MIGAHYDHLGRGEAGAMNRKGEEGQIHPGADDNASGVATLLELADVLAAERAKDPASFSRGVIFAAWAGEEIGIIGSSWFAEHPVVPLTNVVAYLNFDMVGRLNDNKLVLQGIGSSPIWTRLIEKRNVAAGFNVTLQDDPYLPTDTTALYPKGVPVLAFFTGSHDDYHRPTDKADTLNYDGAQRIATLARGIIADLQKAERPAYAQVASKASAGGGRESLRAFIGTIPDYATEVQGVKLSGVRAGGPADKAGIKGGDIVVEFAGTKIANIYDYTYALDAVKIGQPITVVVLRNGERLSLNVTPEARK